jgi:hypothetical protein
MSLLVLSSRIASGSAFTAEIPNRGWGLGGGGGAACSGKEKMMIRA